MFMKKKEEKKFNTSKADIGERNNLNKLGYILY